MRFQYKMPVVYPHVYETVFDISDDGWYDQQHQVRAWCAENIQGPWRYDLVDGRNSVTIFSICIAQESDAALFKLTWG